MEQRGHFAVHGKDRAGHGQVDPGQELLPWPSRPDPGVEHSLGHPARPGLPARDDLKLGTEYVVQARLVGGEISSHKLTMTPGSDIPARSARLRPHPHVGNGPSAYIRR
jgi:hypothetical protein